MTDLFRALGSPSPSPCIGICAIDSASGWCVGCARSGDEIAEWPASSEDEKRVVWQNLGPRRATLGLTCWRLPWTEPDILAFASLALRERLGVWTLGLPGASLSFEEACDVQTAGNRVSARGTHGSLSLEIHEKTAAFAYLIEETLNIGFAAPRAQALLPVRYAVTALDPCEAAPRRNDSGMRFDLGLGTPALRVSVRPSERSLDQFVQLAGQRWTGGCAAWNGEPADLILETSLGSIEQRAVNLCELEIGVMQQNVPGWPLASNFLPGAQLRVMNGALGQALRDL